MAYSVALRLGAKLLKKGAKGLRKSGLAKHKTKLVNYKNPTTGQMSQMARMEPNKLQKLSSGMMKKSKSLQKSAAKRDKAKMISFKPKDSSAGQVEKFNYLWTTSKHQTARSRAYDKATPSWTDKAYGKKTPAQRREHGHFIRATDRTQTEVNKITGNRSWGKKKSVAGESGAIDGSSFSLPKMSSTQKAKAKFKSVGGGSTSTPNKMLGSQGDKIPNNLWTRPEPGKRGTLPGKRKTTAQKRHEMFPNSEKFDSLSGSIRYKTKPKKRKKKRTKGYADVNLKGGQLVKRKKK